MPGPKVEAPWVLTVGGFPRTVQEIANETQERGKEVAGYRPMLMTPGGVSFPATIRQRPVGTVYHVQIGYRMLLLPGDREIATPGGWTRVDQLEAGGQAVVRAGGNDASAAVDGIKLAQSHRFRMIEHVSVAGADAATIASVNLWAATEFVGDNNEPYEINGIPMRNGSQED